jgi:hypothetical protein
MLGYVITGVLAGALIVALALLADRGAREAAWKRIADERRWNREERNQTGV